MKALLLSIIVLLTLILNANAQGRILYYTIGADGQRYAWTEQDEAFSQQLQREQKARAAGAEKLRIASEQANQKLSQQNSAYATLQAERKPGNTEKIIQFRLEQATNGSTAYQLRVSTNYLMGTDGFPTNAALAKYWYNKAQNKD